MGRGGFGSGRTRYATTPDDRDCLKLDVNEFAEILGENGYYSGTYSWQHGGEQSAEVAWRTNDEEPERLTLAYSTRTDGRHTQEILITYTGCNFGGERPWWRCPLCNARIGTLYAVPGKAHFACRECHNFGYTSSRASGNVERTLRMRYNRIRKKLGAEPAHPEILEAGIPDRPKGMHEDTYNQLLEELQQAGEEYHERAFLGPLRRMTGAPPDATEDEMNPYS